RHTSFSRDWSSDVCSSDLELDVAAAPVQLEFAFALAVGRVLAAFDDRQVGLEEAVADRAQVGEVLLEVVMQVVEEQAADAARLRSEERRVGRECRSRGARE